MMQKKTEAVAERYQVESQHPLQMMIHAEDMEKEGQQCSCIATQNIRINVEGGLLVLSKVQVN